MLTMTFLRMQPENWTAFKDIPNLPIEKLLSVCCVAPFGDLLTGQTLIDPSVRTAFEAVFRFLPVYTDEELTKLAEEEAKKKKEPFYHRKVKKHSKVQIILRTVQEVLKSLQTFVFLRQWIFVSIIVTQNLRSTVLKRIYVWILSGSENALCFFPADQISCSYWDHICSAYIGIIPVLFAAAL